MSGYARRGEFGEDNEYFLKERRERFSQNNTVCCFVGRDELAHNAKRKRCRIEALLTEIVVSLNTIETEIRVVPKAQALLKKSGVRQSITKYIRR